MKLLSVLIFYSFSTPAFETSESVFGMSVPISRLGYLHFSSLSARVLKRFDIVCKSIGPKATEHMVG